MFIVEKDKHLRDQNRKAQAGLKSNHHKLIEKDELLLTGKPFYNDLQEKNSVFIVQRDKYKFVDSYQ